MGSAQKALGILSVRGTFIEQSYLKLLVLHKQTKSQVSKGKIDK